MKKRRPIMPLSAELVFVLVCTSITFLLVTDDRPWQRHKQEEKPPISLEQANATDNTQLDCRR
ncbi:hypothetical protein QTH91_09560 [Variovorax dokdonensis]|uniref:Uncharacterized protein n=1 Tax=Variovorax dokdonensis TaxID=344883 RepID=A0ABT7N9W6_9BURK|nr:hypothetical protein [Variovorax dokdonensis]MDM0044727.1 hypothetical protein [Variovorax dokdonensis]